MQWKISLNFVNKCINISWNFSLGTESIFQNHQPALTINLNTLNSKATKKIDSNLDQSKKSPTHTNAPFPQTPPWINLTFYLAELVLSTYSWWCLDRTMDTWGCVLGRLGCPLLEWSGLSLHHHTVLPGCPMLKAQWNDYAVGTASPSLHRILCTIKYVTLMHWEYSGFALDIPAKIPANHRFELLPIIFAIKPALPLIKTFFPLSLKLALRVWLGED